MKKKILEIIKSLFSISLILAILGGGVIFLMFIIALIIGGSQGEYIAVNASDLIMPYFIKLAALAVLSGLLSIYIDGKHSLTLKE